MRHKLLCHCLQMFNLKLLETFPSPPSQFVQLLSAGYKTLMQDSSELITLRADEWKQTAYLRSLAGGRIWLEQPLRVLEVGFGVNTGAQVTTE